ncbi:MAG: NAD(P)-dependent alcohol dehydrogenase [Alphaproteobacteria bacterium]
MPTALVLEEKNKIQIRDIDLDQTMGAQDVRIAIDTVGVCGSDVHYYTHGKIGPFVVNEPMVLGHEAAGTVIETGSSVSNLAVGDRVCMEPGVPDPSSRASKLGLYNVDPAVTFWATPPIHGCLTPEVVHPAAFTYKLPDHVSMAEGAMVEPFAIGMQSAAKAAIKPGDIALVIGAGPIGIMTALAALAGGCAKVFISDLVDEKLGLAAQYDGIEPINAAKQDVASIIAKETANWGVDVVLECSGAGPAYKTALAAIRPGGCLVLVGMPVDPVPFDIVSAQAKEIRIETVFRYANIYDRAINLIASGKVNLKPLISETFDFEDSVEAFDRAVEARPTDVKIQIKLKG